MLSEGPGLPHDYLQETRVLSEFTRLVYFDQRGTGKSQKADPRTYTIEANVEDVENVRGELNLGECWLFGHSWGGMRAQSYVLKYPHNVSKLILADTFSSIGDCNETLARMRAAVPDNIRAIYEKYEREGLYKDRDAYPPEYQQAVELAYERVFIGVTPPPYLQDVFKKVAYDV